MMLIMLMMIFVLFNFTKNRIKIISKTLMEMHLMTVTGLYLKALIGKNLPVLLLVSKKGLGQRNLSFLVNIPFAT